LRRGDLSGESARARKLVDRAVLYNTVTAFAAVLAFPFYWMLLGALVVVITLALALSAGYALARLTGKWGERLGIAIFLTYLVPSTLLFIPMSASWRPSAYKTPCGRWSWSRSFTIPFCVGSSSRSPRTSRKRRWSTGAACLITSISVAILYNLFLDRFISGFTVGAIK
jgi:ABC-type glycerol-3-phosphate transport system permease component